MRKILLFLAILISNQLIGQTTDVISRANQLGTDWKFEEAIELLRSEIKTNPYNAELYHWLGRMHMLDYVRYLVKEGDDEKARLVLDKMKELMPAFVFEPYPALSEEIRKLTEQIGMK